MCDATLMNPIGSTGLLHVLEFRSQDLSNTAWSFAKQLVRHAPLLAAIYWACSGHDGDEDQIMSAFVWALWRGGEHSLAWHTFRSWSTVDVAAIAFMLMGAAWGRDQASEDQLWDVVGRSELAGAEAHSATACQGPTESAGPWCMRIKIVDKRL